MDEKPEKDLPGTGRNRYARQNKTKRPALACQGGPRQRLDNPILTSLATLPQANITSLSGPAAHYCILYTRHPYTKHRLKKNKVKISNGDTLKGVFQRGCRYSALKTGEVLNELV